MSAWQISSMFCAFRFCLSLSIDVLCGLLTLNKVTDWVIAITVYYQTSSKCGHSIQSRKAVAVCFYLISQERAGVHVHQNSSEICKHTKNAVTHFPMATPMERTPVGMAAPRNDGPSEWRADTDVMCSQSFYVEVKRSRGFTKTRREM